MASPVQARPLQPGDVLVVIHDFDARSGDELTLRKAERIQLIELDDGFGDGWYLGNHLSKHQTGLFPGVYTTKATSAPARSPPHSRSASSTHQATTVTANGQAPSAYQGGSSQFPQSMPPMSQLDTANLQLPASITDSPVADNTRSSLPAAHHTTYVQRSISEALRGDEHGEDSPVMNQTLSVIDEHIENLATPRQSLAPPHHHHNNKGDDSESEYSARLERHSYMAGPETDEEDNGDFDEATVRSWDHEQTASHLREIGVDPKHCDIFEQQEISGDVLLDMDQSFLNMKEYDFGVMGRRLKTWHKIRDFQQAVKGSSKPTSRSFESDQGPSSLAHQRMPSLTLRQHNDTPPITEEDSDMPHPLQPGQSSKRMSWTASSTQPSWRSTIVPDSPSKVPPPIQRQPSGHSQVPPSIDFGTQPDLELTSVSSHQKQSSMDQTWSMGGTTLATTPASSLKPPRKQDSLDNSPALSSLSPVDIDRGYFSGNEVENRKSRNRLSKRDTPDHSRKSSLLDQPAKRLSALKRHSRLSSVDSVHDIAPPLGSSSNPFTLRSAKGRFRSASTRSPVTRSMIVNSSPTVTNLEEEAMGVAAQDKIRMQDRARKLMGFRAASDTATSAEKQSAQKETSPSEPARIDLASPTPTGSDTPSITSKSIDADTPDPSLKAIDSITALPNTAKAPRPRPKGKMRTSAYTHGLLTVTPAAARETADYSGWMKKKSSGIMTTWKPRLFILRGKRLSYYYAESDTTERGIIDISGHKVLVANNDPITTLHATVTGATKSPPPQSSPSDQSASKLTEPGVFFFKLVPPKSGTARAVQFTKPTIHYFQVDDAIVGRKWMGEIMKATIEHDLTSFETTNKQKTISLAKARARRERPPALDDTKVLAVTEPAAAAAPATEPEGTGLNIKGLEYQDSAMSLGTPTKAEAPVGDEPDVRTASPKALAMLGLGPRLSQRSSKRASLSKDVEADTTEDEVGASTENLAASEHEEPPAVPAKD